MCCTAKREGYTSTLDQRGRLKSQQSPAFDSAHENVQIWKCGMTSCYRITAVQGITESNTRYMLLDQYTGSKVFNYWKAPSICMLMNPAAAV